MSADPELLAEVARGEGKKLNELALHVPSARLGRKATLSRLLRWGLKGVRLADGSVVRLGMVRVAGTWVSSVNALARFISAQTPTFEDGITVPRSASKREKVAAAASAQLEKAGW